MFSCSQLGAIAAAGYYSNYVWPHNIVDLNCTGEENSFLDCSYNGLSDYVCPDSNDASVSCQSR